MTGVGQIFFYSRADVEAALADGWTIESLEHVEVANEDKGVHAEWRAIARKAERS